MWFSVDSIWLHNTLQLGSADCRSHIAVLLGNTTTCGWSYTEFLHAAETYLLWPDVTLQICSVFISTCPYRLDILFLPPMSDMQDYNKPYPGRSHELFLVTLLLLLGWVSEDFYYCLGGWCSQCTTTATTWPCNYTKAISPPTQTHPFGTC